MTTASAIRPVRISVKTVGSSEPAVQHEFASSPVQLGRDHRADLRLPYDFVSGWHAMVRFDEGSAEYYDLGSTNGTRHRGRRLTAGDKVDFDDPVEVRIADLSVTLSRSGTAGRRRTLTPDSSRTSAGTIVCDHHDTALPLPGSRPGGGDPWMTMVGRLSRSLLPDTAAPTTAAQARRFLERVGDIMRTCARGLVQLQAGQEQMSQEIGVKAVERHGALRFVSSEDEALAYLFGAEHPGERSRLEELAESFADTMIHEVAMLNGVLAGARSVLGALDPGTIERTTVPGRLTRGRDLWRSFQQQWQHLVDHDEPLLGIVFGPEFSHEYQQARGELRADRQRNGNDGAHPSC
ncbi:MAG: FHA domain-containing protein [Deltaproteobacteria bacterium]|nr:FHA domain-containing protein [Deltaproteobacteria bacterium]